MKKLIAAVVVSSFLLSSPLALAKANGAKRFMSEYKGLSLTQEQRQALKVIVKDSREEAKIYREDKAATREAFKGLMQSEAWNNELALTLITEKTDAGQQTRLIRAKAKAQSYALLTDEQKLALNEKQANKQTKQNRGKRLDKILAKVDLNDEQLAQIDALKTANESQRETFKEARKAFKDAEKAIIQAENFDQDAWLALYQANSDNMIAAKLASTKFRYDLKQTLTEDQFKDVRKLIKKKGKKAKNKGVAEEQSA